MQQRDIRLLILIVIIAALAAWVSWPTNPGLHVRIGNFSLDRDIRIAQGLDLQGGMQVLLEADVPANQSVDASAMDAARGIVESRVNGLGVAEPVVQAVGGRRVLVELPGVQDPEAAVATLRQTGLMEWIDTGGQFLPPGTQVQTDIATSSDGQSSVAPTAAASPTASPAPAVAATGGITFTESVTATQTVTPALPVYHTVLTGANLNGATVEFDAAGAPVIGFELDSDGSAVFADFTTRNVGKYLAIALDKVIISCPQINEPIPNGRGQISGSFTVEEAQSMVLQLRYGSLPIPLKVVDTRAVGPSLGQDSVSRSVRAGTIGLIIVLLFMLIYYRLLGLLAAIALIIYALLTLALFKLIPVTLTLPGIAGFLVSVGMAVDANILIFERIREELRAGRSLQRSIDSGFRRAWTSILDSNISTWITCAILFAFGSSFGATVVKGFAVTLALGVLVSIFTAITVTRTFVRTAFAVGGEDLREKKWLLSV